MKLTYVEPWRLVAVVVALSGLVYSGVPTARAVAEPDRYSWLDVEEVAGANPEFVLEYVRAHPEALSADVRGPEGRTLLEEALDYIYSIAEYGRQSGRPLSWPPRPSGYYYRCTACVLMTLGAEHTIFSAAGLGRRVSTLLTEDLALARARDAEARTPLHYATLIGTEDSVEILVWAGAPLNAQDERGRTPLHNAAHRGLLDPLSLLLGLGADPNVPDNRGNTPLHTALYVRPKDVQVIRLLLEAGADPNAVNEEGRHALAYRTISPAVLQALREHGARHDVFSAAWHGDTEALRSILRRDPELVHARDRRGRMPLHVAVARPDCVQVLLAAGADIEVKGEGWRALHHAAARGSVETVEALLAAGADVNACSGYHSTPLHLALRHGRADNVRVLLENGAELNADCSEGWDPVEVVIQSDEASPEALCAACKAVFEHDPARAAEVAAQTDLYDLSFVSRVQLLELLLDYGAEPNRRDKHGRTTLHYAAESHSELAVRLLLEHGADLHARDEEGKTPLDRALKALNVRNAQILREHWAKE